MSHVTREERGGEEGEGARDRERVAETSKLTKEREKPNMEGRITWSGFVITMKHGQDHVGCIRSKGQGL